MNSIQGMMNVLPGWARAGGMAYTNVTSGAGLLLHFCSPALAYELGSHHRLRPSVRR